MHMYSQLPNISSYTITTRFSPINGTMDHTHFSKQHLSKMKRRDILRISVRTALMRLMILPFTPMSCPPP